jgi:hypothetical protein
MTKGQNKTFNRRRMRRKDRNSTVKRDIMLGKASRRGWGKGIAK